MLQTIKNDIIELLLKHFSDNDTNTFYINKRKFYQLFMIRYPLRYQKYDKNILSSNILVNIIKTMNICSPFKFKKSKVKRYKFLQKKVKEYERRLCL
jgi:hypothetical protein